MDNRPAKRRGPYGKRTLEHNQKFEELSKVSKFNEDVTHCDVVCNDNVIGIEDIKEEDCITIPLPSTSQTRSQRDWQTQLDDKDAGLPTDYLCVSLLLAYIAYKILYVWSYTCI